ncbi:MAG: hypothetical protein ABIG40_02320, partial [Parcubacteria group bacterium]
FTQFIYLGTGGAICLTLYFSMAKTRFFLFLLVSAAIMLLAGALAFLKIGGRSVPTLLKNFFFFSIGPKIYLWRRKNVPPKMIKRIENKTKLKDTKSSTLKFAEKSQLRSLSNSLETKK